MTIETGEAGEITAKLEDDGLLVFEQDGEEVVMKQADWKQFTDHVGTLLKNGHWTVQQ